MRAMRVPSASEPACGRIKSRFRSYDPVRRAFASMHAGFATATLLSSSKQLHSGIKLSRARRVMK